MKIITDFVTNSSEADYYDCDCDDCKDCDVCQDDCNCDCDCDCDYDCDCRECNCDDCIARGFDMDPEEYPDYWWEDLDD